MMNEAESVALAQQKRPEGFRSIWEMYGRYVYTLACRMLKDSQLAEDAVQETFAAAFRAIDKFRGNSRFKTWLYSIAYHEILRVANLHHKLALESEPDEEVASLDPSYSALENRLDVQEILDCLPERDRAILIMAYWDDLTCSEIADVLSITPNHAKVLLFRARSRFAAIWPNAEKLALKEAKIS